MWSLDCVVAIKTIKPRKDLPHILETARLGPAGPGLVEGQGWDAVP